jgi:MraZ protein
MLIGEHIHSIDDKNRISLPAKFRKEIGKRVVVAPGLDNCLFVFTEREWKRISEALAKSNLLQASNRSFARFFFGGAVAVMTDNIGRILIPDYLKNYADLKNEVIVIGVLNRLEIWNDRRWQNYKKNVTTKADDLAEKLGELGIL